MKNRHATYSTSFVATVLQLLLFWSQCTVSGTSTELNAIQAEKIIQQELLLQTLTILHTAFLIQFKWTVSRNSQRFCKAHVISGIYKDFYILCSCFCGLIFILGQ